MKMKEGKKVSESQIQKIFKEAKQKWQVINFKRESRPLAKATYTIAFSGST